MAKARAKTGKSVRRKAARKRTVGRRQVQLKPVFKSLSSSLAQLKRVEQTRQVKGAIVRLTRCLNAIEDICAPDMIIPIEPTR